MWLTILFLHVLFFQHEGERAAVQTFWFIHLRSHSWISEHWSQMCRSTPGRFRFWNSPAYSRSGLGCIGQYFWLCPLFQLAPSLFLSASQKEHHYWIGLGLVALVMLLVALAFFFRVDLVLVYRDVCSSSAVCSGTSLPQIFIDFSVEMLPITCQWFRLKIKLIRS